MIARSAYPRGQVLTVAAALLLASPAAAAAPRPVNAARAAWQLPFGDEFRDVGLYVAGDLLVALEQGGATASFDLETGRRRALLVAPPWTCSGRSHEGCAENTTSVIDPYAWRSALLHGALVGTRGATVGAVDVRTGRTLWSTPITGIDPKLNEYTVRDSAQLVQAGALDVLGFEYLRQEGDGNWPNVHAEEAVLALDPATGEERWRKVVVVHAWGEKRGQGMRVAGCGGLVLTWTPGRLTALDASDGSERWTVALAEAAAPLLSCGESGVAIASEAASFREGVPRSRPRTGSLRWIDGRSGTELTSVPLPAGTLARHLLAGRSSVLVSLQDDSADGPTASVVELELPSGTLLWRRAVNYTVSQLHADEASVYALAGDGRLWSMARGTGELRWGIRAGPGATFAVGSTRRSRARVVLAVDRRIAAFDPKGGQVPAPMEPYLRLEHVEDKASGDQPRCRSAAVSWIDGEERVVWRRDLPEHLQGSEPGPCAEATSVVGRRFPRAGVGPVIDLDGSILLGHDEGVLALDRGTGAVLLDLQVPRANPAGERFYFDDGGFSLSGGPPCSGHSSRAWVFDRCADRVVYFNGSTAALFAGRPFALEARAVFSTRTHLRWNSAVIPLGRRKLVLEGRVFER